MEAGLSTFEDNKAMPGAAALDGFIAIWTKYFANKGITLSWQASPTSMAYDFWLQKHIDGQIAYAPAKVTVIEFEKAKANSSHWMALLSSTLENMELSLQEVIKNMPEKAKAKKAKKAEAEVKSVKDELFKSTTMTTGINPWEPLTYNLTFEAPTTSKQVYGVGIDFGQGAPTKSTPKQPAKLPTAADLYGDSRPWKAGDPAPEGRPSAFDETSPLKEPTNFKAVMDQLNQLAATKMLDDIMKPDPFLACLKGPKK